MSGLQGFAAAWFGSGLLGLQAVRPLVFVPMFKLVDWVSNYFCVNSTSPLVSHHRYPFVLEHENMAGGRAL